MVNYPVHPIADLFPMMSDEDLQIMAEGIRQDGLLFPITLADYLSNGEKVRGIIDGRNRTKACAIAGVKPRYEIFNGKGDIATEKEITTYIEQANIDRRSMTTGQRAMARAMLHQKGP